MDFGWSLADVLKKSKHEIENKESNEKEKNQECKELIDKDILLNEKIDESVIENKEKEESNKEKEESKKEIEELKKEIEESKKEKSDGEKDSINEEDEKDKDDWMEIGTWSNDMAQLGEDFSKDLPTELSMVL